MSKVARTVRSHIPQADCLSTCTTYLLLVVLLSVKQSDEITYNVEFDKNQTSCKHGLIENRDTIHMSITMYTKHGEVNSYTHFTMEAVQPETNHSIMMCKLLLQFACGFKVNQGCFCSRITGLDIYHYTYLSVANSLYSQNMIKIMGELINNVTFPRLFEENHQVLVTLRVNGIKVDDATTNCTARVPTNSVVVFKFCTAGLTQPTLNVNFSGRAVESSSGSPCMKANFTTGSENWTQMVYYSYDDTCFKDRFHCSVQVYIVPTTITAPTASALTATSPYSSPDNTTKAAEDDDYLADDDPTSLERTFVLIGILVVLLSLIALVYFKLIRGRRQRETVESAAGRSTMLDPQPPPTPLSPSVSRTASLAKRLTLVFSPIPKQPMASATNYTPKILEYETEV